MFLFFCSYPPTPNTPGSNTPSNNDYPGGPQQGNPALSAALVAAAATASATATATATMMMHNDHPSNQQMNMQMNMNSQYGPGMQVNIVYLPKLCYVWSQKDQNFQNCRNQVFEIFKVTMAYCNNKGNAFT